MLVTPRRQHRNGNISFVDNIEAEGRLNNERCFKPYGQKPADIKRDWYLVDASTMPLGKLAVVIADKLMGKSKTTLHPTR